MYICCIYMCVCVCVSVRVCVCIYVICVYIQRNIAERETNSNDIVSYIFLVI